MLPVERARFARNPFGFVAGLSAQSVIDRGDEELHVRSMQLRPARDEMHHGDAVGAAGDGKDDVGKRSEGSEQRVELGVPDRLSDLFGGMAARGRRTQIRYSQFAGAPTWRAF